MAHNPGEERAGSHTSADRFWPC